MHIRKTCLWDAEATPPKIEAARERARSRWGRLSLKGERVRPSDPCICDIVRVQNCAYSMTSLARARSGRWLLDGQNCRAAALQDLGHEQRAPPKDVGTVGAV
jgi:hypothetical protein